MGATVAKIIGSRNLRLNDSENFVSESFGKLKKAHQNNRQRTIQEADWVENVSELKSELKLKDVAGLSLALKTYNLDELRSIVEVCGRKDDLMKNRHRQNRCLL